MPDALTPQALDLSVPFDAGGFGDLLRDRGFAEERLLATIVFDRHVWPPRIDQEATLQRLTSNDPFSILVRLFRLEQTLPRAEVAEVLAPFAIDDLVALGLLRLIEPDQVAARVYLGVRRGLLMFSDWPSRRNDPLYVLGQTQTSEKLEALTPRRPFDRMLDLGTGNGLLALLAGRHCRQVVATDINPRAINLARFNARVNRVENIDFRLGSWFEPVGTELFNLVVCNPPFVISPHSQSLYRDGGFETDGLMRMLAREIPARLARGGIGLFIGNWLVEEGDRVRRPRDWLSDRGADVIVLHGTALTAEEYVRQWIITEHDFDSPGYREDYPKWLNYFRQHGIEQIVSGAIILRQQTPPNTFLGLEIREQEQGDYGDQLEQLYVQADLLRRCVEDSYLLNLRLQVAEGHIMEQVFLRSDGEYHLQRCTIRHQRGLTLPEALDQYSLPFLQAFNGQRALGEILADLAAQLAAPPAIIREQGLRLTRRLIARGYLVAAPVSAANSPSSTTCAS
jgi:methylase of polypeptide subunit release factors